MQKLESPLSFSFTAITLLKYALLVVPKSITDGTSVVIAASAAV